MCARKADWTDVITTVCQPDITGLPLDNDTTTANHTVSMKELEPLVYLLSAWGPWSQIQWWNTDGQKLPCSVTCLHTQDVTKVTCTWILGRCYLFSPSCLWFKVHSNVHNGHIRLNDKFSLQISIQLKKGCHIAIHKCKKLLTLVLNNRHEKGAHGT